MKVHPKTTKRTTTTTTGPKLAAVPPPPRDEKELADRIRATLACGLRGKLEVAQNMVWTASIALDTIARGCTETQAVADMLETLAADCIRWIGEYDDLVGAVEGGKAVQQ